MRTPPRSGRIVEGGHRARPISGRGIPPLSAFLDTSGLYAVLVGTEERHADAVLAFRHLLSEGRALSTTSYVVVETAALLQHRIGLAPVRDLMEHVLAVASVEYVSEALHRRGVDRLIREDRRRLSLVDCISFEFMSGLGLRDALTLDEQFEQAGFRVLPPGLKSRRT